MGEVVIGYGPRPVGLVVCLPMNRATVHYIDCPSFLRSFHRDLPLPGKATVRICSYCRPSEEDIRACPPDVSWYPFSPGRVVEEVIHAEPEYVDNIVARQSMGYGKTKAKRTGWT